MADAFDRQLNEQILAIRANLLALTLTFRRYRRGEFQFEPIDAAAFEDELVRLGAQISVYSSTVVAQIDQCAKALSDAIELLDRHAPKPEPARAPEKTNVVILPVIHRSHQEPS